jgi:tRNA-dihydrouridine synthase C
VADPLLARRIREGRQDAPTAADWEEIRDMIAVFWSRVQAKVTPTQSPGRLKQWLGMMQRIYPQAGVLFREIREARKAPEVSLGLARCGMRLETPRDAAL